MSGDGDGRSFDEPVYEMFWDCAYCGAEKLLGVTHRHCPQCGAAQDPKARYFPPEEEKVAVQDHVYFGADWKCENCGTPNSNKADFCGNCGAPKDGNQQVDLAHERKEETPPPPPQEPKASGGGGVGRYIAGCGCLSVLALAVFCGISAMWTRADSATVTAHNWEYTIQIQEFRAEREDDWCDQMPAQAYDVRRSQKQRDTKRVQDGETCKTKNVDNGDGSFRQVQECKPKYIEKPVYDQHCAYKIDKWADAQVAREKGNDLSPRWPQPRIKTCPSARVGCQRQGAKNQTHNLVLTDSGGTTHTCAVSESKWRALKDGAKVEVAKQVIGGGVDCSSL